MGRGRSTHAIPYRAMAWVPFGPQDRIPTPRPLARCGVVVNRSPATTFFGVKLGKIAERIAATPLEGVDVDGREAGRECLWGCGRSTSDQAPGQSDPSGKTSAKTPIFGSISGVVDFEHDALVGARARTAAGEPAGSGS